MHDPEEFTNVFSIPSNYTESGRLLGLLRTRNAVEAIAVLVLAGYPEWLLPLGLKGKLVLMVCTLLPLAFLAAVGVDGDSLTEFLGHMLRFWRGRRILHYRRIL